VAPRGVEEKGSKGGAALAAMGPMSEPMSGRMRRIAAKAAPTRGCAVRRAPAVMREKRQRPGEFPGWGLAAWLGWAGLGWAGLGLAWLGLAWLGLAWQMIGNAAKHEVKPFWR
jgi:hypothetical protein